jgi:hypothetical protein
MATATPDRTYTYSYLHEANSAYLNAYIRNRPTLVTVTVGATVTPLLTNAYDAYSTNALVDRPISVTGLFR